MKFIQIDINNFMILKEASLVLKDRGLVLVSGSNHDSSAFDSNGAGKSTLFDAVTWCLYGQTVRGLKADDILPTSGEEDTKVEVLLYDEDDSVHYKIRRYRKDFTYKNELFLLRSKDSEDWNDARGSCVDDTQEKIITVLGMDFDTFTTSILFGQGVTRKLKKFTEMTDVEQKAILEQILGTTIFTEAYERALKKERIVAQSVQQAHAEYESKFNRLETMKKEFANLQRAHDNFEKEKKRSIFALQLKKARANQDQDDLWETIRTEMGAIVKIDEWLVKKQQCEAELQAVAEKKKELENRVSSKLYEGKTRFGELRGIRDRLSADLDTLYDPETKDAECDRCGGIVSKDRLLGRKNRLEQERDRVLEDIRALKKTLDEVEVGLSSAKESFDQRNRELRAEIEACNKNINAVQLKLQQTSSRYDQIRKQDRFIAEVAVSVHKEASKTSGMFSILEDMEDGIDLVEKELYRLRITEKKLSIEQAALRFWKEAYGPSGIRSHILDSVVPFLSERANEYCDILSDGQIAIEFSTQKALKSGDLRDKFTVTPINRNGAKVYEGNSGGERRRIDVAVALSVCDLVSSRSKKKFNLLMLDEILESLDQAGVDAAMRLLQKLAETKETILVVTHLQGLKDQFEQEILVERRNGQSVINEVA